MYDGSFATGTCVGQFLRAGRWAGDACEGNPTTCVRGIMVGIMVEGDEGIRACVIDCSSGGEGSEAPKRW